MSYLPLPPPPLPRSLHPTSSHLQVLGPPPHLHISLRKGDGGLDHLDDVDPLLGSADGKGGDGHDPGPGVVVGKVGEAQQVEREEEDFVRSAEGEQNFLYWVSAWGMGGGRSGKAGSVRTNVV